MKKIFACADRYIKECDWKDLAMLKFCLCAIGVMLGLSIPKEKKKVPLIVAGIVFTVTYIPLMMKYGKVAAETLCQKEE